MNKKSLAAAYALLAAVLYGIQVPFSKILMNGLDPLFLAALLYLGAGTGMLAVRTAEYFVLPRRREAVLEKKDFPYVLLMVILDIAAPVLLLTGLRMPHRRNRLCIPVCGGNEGRSRIRNSARLPNGRLLSLQSCLR